MRYIMTHHIRCLTRHDALRAAQVKDVEAAAARAAFESSHIIEEAMAQAADVRRQATQQAQQEACPA